MVSQSLPVQGFCGEGLGYLHLTPPFTTADNCYIDQSPLS